MGKKKETVRVKLNSFFDKHRNKGVEALKLATNMALPGIWAAPTSKLLSCLKKEEHLKKEDFHSILADNEEVISEFISGVIETQFMEKFVSSDIVNKAEEEFDEAKDNDIEFIMEKNSKLYRYFCFNKSDFQEMQAIYDELSQSEIYKQRLSDLLLLNQEQGVSYMPFMKDMLDGLSNPFQFLNDYYNNNSIVFSDLKDKEAFFVGYKKIIDYLAQGRVGAAQGKIKELYALNCESDDLNLAQVTTEALLGDYQMAYDHLKTIKSKGNKTVVFHRVLKKATLVLRRGELINERWQVLDLIGLGGMGQVYKVYDTQYERFTSSYEKIKALKVINSEWSEDESFIASFKKEIDVLASLKHTNIVRYRFRGEHDGKLYFVMDYVDNSITWKKFVRMFYSREISVTQEEYCEIGIKIFNALHYMHKNNVYHCDINPSNILIKKCDYEPYIIDMGITRVESKQVNTLTRSSFNQKFAAVEQIHGNDTVDNKSDIYSACTTFLYFFTAPDVPKKDSYDKFVMSKPFKNLFIKGLEFERPKRYNNADEVIMQIVDIDYSIVLGKNNYKYYLRYKKELSRQSRYELAKVLYEKKAYKKIIDLINSKHDYKSETWGAKNLHKCALFMVDYQQRYRTKLGQNKKNEFFNKHIKNFKEDTNWLNSNRWDFSVEQKYNIALLYEQIKDVDNKEEVLERCTVKNKYYIPALYKFAQFYLNVGNINGLRTAIRYFRICKFYKYKESAFYLKVALAKKNKIDIRNVNLYLFNKYFFLIVFFGILSASLFSSVDIIKQKIPYIYLLSVLIILFRFVRKAVEFLSLNNMYQKFFVEKNTNNMDKNEFEKTLKEVKLLLNREEPKALNILACSLYQTSDSCENEHDDYAFELLELSSKKGYQTAYYNLALCHLMGFGVEKRSRIKARECAIKALAGQDIDNFLGVDLTEPIKFEFGDEYKKLKYLKIWFLLYNIIMIIPNIIKSIFFFEINDNIKDLRFTKKKSNKKNDFSYVG